MKAKALELRDRHTFIPILCVDMNPSVYFDMKPGVYHDDGPGLSAELEAQRYLLRRCGYPCDGRPNIIVTRLDGNGPANNDPYFWVVHLWIIDHWNELSDGDVVDGEFIRGETSTRKLSERITESVLTGRDEASP